MRNASLLAAGLLVAAGQPTRGAAQLTFDSPVGISLRSSQLDVADVDGDGAADILIAGEDQRWLKGPSFTTEYVLGVSDGGPYAARSADIDGDGDPDWVTSNGARESGTTGEIYVYLNPGGAAATGTWPRQTIYSGPGRHLNDLAIADVDADGKLDVVVKTWTASDRLVIAFQDAPTSWTARAFATGESGQRTEGFAVGEIDGGGAPEIVQAGFYYSAADWRSDTPVSTPIATRFLEEEMKAGVADFDGDGDGDVYMASAEGREDIGAYWYRNDGAGAFTEFVIEPGVGQLHMHDVVDVDLDGDIDVVAGRSFGEAGVYIYYNDGAGDFTKGTVDAGVKFYTGVAADLDGDADLDLIGVEEFYKSSGISYFVNVGAATPPDAPTDATAALAVGGGEVDVSWTDNSADEASFQLERRRDAGAWGALATLPQNATVYTDAAVAPGATYAYRVRAVNGGGASPFATTGGVTTFAEAGAVTATPAGGAYSDPPTITLAVAAPADEIRYTLDGVDPTAASPLYVGPFALATSAEVRAAGFGTALQRGPVTSETYTVAQGGNFPPRANAGPDVTATGLDPVGLDGSATSDLDHANAQLTFAWTRVSGPAATLADGSAPATTFAPSAYGTYVWSLTVTDPAGATDADEVTVVVADADADLVAYWKLDEATGAVAADERGSHPGTLANGIGWSEGGVYGSAVENGTAGGRVGVAPFDIGGAALTLSCWVNLGDLDNPEGRFISKASGNNADDHYWMLSQIGTTGVRFRLKTENGGTATLASAEGQLSVGEWVFVAATYDGAEMRLFVNGQSVASAAKTGAIITDDAVGVGLANQPAGVTDRPLRGALDEVKVYDRALAAQELFDEYVAGSPPLASAVANFAARYDDARGAVDLAWSSRDEDGVEAYVILRAGATAADPEEVAVVPARHAHRGEVTYAFADRNPLTGTSYYRYRRESAGEPAELSDWVVVRRATAEALAVWPNPSFGDLGVAPSARPRTLLLVDGRGRTVEQLTLAAGRSAFALEVSAGIYTLYERETGANCRLLIR